MTIFQAVVYGIVQGVTEFLPVSSTAHLTLLPWIAGWKDPGVAFDVALHLGTAAAVILFFIRDWLRMFRAGFTAPRSPDGRLFWCVVLATIPGGIAGVLLDPYMSTLRDPVLIGTALIVMGAVLFLADRFGRKADDLAQIGARRSLLVGVAQVLAVIPGVSRSGITMSMGRLLGLKRESIAKFTFLMSAPIILADGMYHLVFHPHEVLGASPLPFFVALVTAAVVGALSIRFLLDFLKKKGFAAFAVYRFAFGAFVIALAVVR